ncbi:MAG: DUF4157 domain-containing protein [Polyangiaceae bacterium]|nr:DUF4157 domain-containing protein [Polyangiaceae bacterium]
MRAESAGPAQGEGAAFIKEAAARGIRGSGGPLPHGDAIQRAFGHHDISGVRAHVGSEAAEASMDMGAAAFATGNHVAFAGTPDLYTAAHEAAHVVQQQGEVGVHLKGGVGEVGDPYERHADAVADRVASGLSAESLLDQYAGPSTKTSGGLPTVQRTVMMGARPVYLKMFQTWAEKEGIYDDMSQAVKDEIANLIQRPHPVLGVRSLAQLVQIAESNVEFANSQQDEQDDANLDDNQNAQPNEQNALANEQNAPLNNQNNQNDDQNDNDDDASVSRQSSLNSLSQEIVVNDDIVPPNDDQPQLANQAPLNNINVEQPNANLALNNNNNNDLDEDDEPSLHLQSSLNSLADDENVHAQNNASDVVSDDTLPTLSSHVNLTEEDLQKLVPLAQEISKLAFSTVNVVDEVLKGKGYEWNDVAVDESFKTAMGSVALSNKHVKQRTEYSVYFIERGRQLLKKNGAYVRCGESAAVVAYLLSQHPLFSKLPVYAVKQGNPASGGHWYVLVGDPTEYKGVSYGKKDKDKAVPTSNKCLTIDIWGANLISTNDLLDNSPKPNNYASMKQNIINSDPSFVNYPGKQFVRTKTAKVEFLQVLPVPPQQQELLDEYAPEEDDEEEQQ